MKTGGESRRRGVARAFEPPFPDGIKSNQIYMRGKSLKKLGKSFGVFVGIVFSAYKRVFKINPPDIPRADFLSLSFVSSHTEA